MFKGRIAAVLALVLCFAFFSTLLRGRLLKTAVSGGVSQRAVVILDAGHAEQAKPYKNQR